MRRLRDWSTMFLVSVRIVRYSMLALVFERASLMRVSSDLMASAIDSNSWSRIVSTVSISEKSPSRSIRLMRR